MNNTPNLSHYKLEVGTIQNLKVTTLKYLVRNSYQDNKYKKGDLYNGQNHP